MAQLTRRRLLAGLSALSLPLAGCSSSEQATGTPSSTPEPITGVSVTGTAVVVDLVDDTDVDQLSLIGPDGEAVATSDVTAGETTVSLQILEVDPGVTGYEHYQPGTHELVAKRGEKEFTTEIPLRPDLEVSRVKQHQNGSSDADLGRLEVWVKNRGSGPTWVHDITFEEAPYYATNDSLRQDPGIISIDTVGEGQNAIVPPASERGYISRDAPLLFTGSSQGECASKSTFGVILGTPLESIRGSVTSQNRGAKRVISTTDQYACSDVGVTLNQTVENAE